MGGAVKAVTNTVKKVVKDPVALATGGSSIVTKKLLKAGGIDLQKGILDPMRGKYKVKTASARKDYKVDPKAFQALKGQKQLLSDLQKQSRAPIDVSNSIAQQQLKQGTNRNLAQLAGTVAGSRGPNQALAMRAGLQQQAAANQESVGQSGLLRANEYQQAVQNKMANQNQLSQALAENQRMREAGQGLRAQVAGAGQQADLQAKLGNMGAFNQQAAGQAAATKDLIGNIASTAGAIFSDKDMKKQIKPAKLEDLMMKINASKFKYKQPNGESYQKGSVDGIMAQDLEKSELGNEMVSDSSMGKQVDIKKAVPVTMAAVSEIMKRIKKLEKKA